MSQPVDQLTIARVERVQKAREMCAGLVKAMATEQVSLLMPTINVPGTQEGSVFIGVLFTELKEHGLKVKHFSHCVIGQVRQEVADGLGGTRPISVPLLQVAFIIETNDGAPRKVLLT